MQAPVGSLAVLVTERKPRQRKMLMVTCSHRYNRPAVDRPWMGPWTPEKRAYNTPTSTLLGRGTRPASDARFGRASRLPSRERNSPLRFGDGFQREVVLSEGICCISVGRSRYGSPMDSERRSEGVSFSVLRSQTNSEIRLVSDL